jgi:hypothetical protein
MLQLSSADDSENFHASHNDGQSSTRVKANSGRSSMRTTHRSTTAVTRQKISDKESQTKITARSSTPRSKLRFRRRPSCMP